MRGAQEDSRKAADFLEAGGSAGRREDEQGTTRICRGMAKDRVIATVNPEMRHGHKTPSNNADGHKALAAGVKQGGLGP